MKTATVSGINIRYPEVAFAFNPIAVFVESDKDESVILKVEGEGLSVNVSRDLYENKTVFDLSAVARGLFDRMKFHQVELLDKNLHKRMKFHLIEIDGGIETVKWTSDEISVFWGAMQIGETYSQSKRLKMFKGYPFTVPLYLHTVTNDEHGSLPVIQYSTDGSGFKVLKSSSGVNLSSGKYNIDISGIDANRHISLLIDMGVNNSTFDIYFDYTFRGVGVDSVWIDVDFVDTCDAGGHYLRWIDKHGEYRYWLFREGVRTSTVKNQSVVFDNVYYTTDFTNNYHHGLGKSIGKEVEESLKLFVSLVDFETYDLLLGLVESPVVDLLVSNNEQGISNWVSVSVAEGSYPRSATPLQDFELFLIPNKKQVQRL